MSGDRNEPTPLCSPGGWRAPHDSDDWAEIVHEKEREAAKNAVQPAHENAAGGNRRDPGCWWNPARATIDRDRVDAILRENAAREAERMRKEKEKEGEGGQ